MMSAQIADQVANKADLIRVQSNSWLIKNQEVRLVAHRVCQPHALPIAFREVADEFFLHILESAQLENIPHAFPETASWNALQGGAVAEEFTDPHICVKGHIFRHVADMLTSLKRIRKNIESSNLRLSRCRGKEA